MEAHYRAFGGRLVFKVEGTTLKDVIEQISPIAEVFDGDVSCGKCSSPNIYPRMRTAKDFEYYELVCSDCEAKLSFGQRKDGGLWAKRKDDQGNMLDHRGWHIYRALEAPKEAAPSPATPRPAQKKDDPRLPVFLKRCASRAQTDEVFGEILAAIEGRSSQAIADQVWAEAITKNGDPARRPASLSPVLLFLLDALDGYEKSANVANTV